MQTISFKYKGCFVFWSVLRSLLVGGWGCTALVDLESSVPCTSRDGVELEILLERLSLARCEVESLLLVMDRQKVEGRHE